VQDKTAFAQISSTDAHLAKRDQIISGVEPRRHTSAAKHTEHKHTEAKKDEKVEAAAKPKK